MLVSLQILKVNAWFFFFLNTELSLLLVYYRKISCGCANLKIFLKYNERSNVHPGSSLHQQSTHSISWWQCCWLKACSLVSSEDYFQLWKADSSKFTTSSQNSIFLRWLVDAVDQGLALFTPIQVNSRGPPQLQSFPWDRSKPFLIWHCHPASPLPSPGYFTPHTCGKLRKHSLKWPAC